MKFTVTLLLLLLFSSSSFSQNPVFRKYTTEDGLPGNEIYHILQDTKGFIWIATNNGVARFDGNWFETFTVENGLPDTEILKMHEDHRGRIWFISFTGPLSFYDGTVHHAGNTNFLRQLQFKNSVQAFTSISENKILISEKYNATYILQDTVLSLYDSIVYYSIVKQHDASFVLVNPNLISERTRGQETFKKTGLFNSFNGHAAYNKVLNRILFVADSGLFSYSNHQLTYIRNSTMLIKKAVRFISCDEEGFNWMGTEDGCFRFRINEKNEVVQSEKYFEGITVSSVFQDHDRNFWIATRSDGLLMVPSLKVKLFNKSSGLADNNVTTAFRTSDQKIICGTLNGYVHLLDEQDRIVDSRNLNSSRVRKIIGDPSGHAFIACESGIFIRDSDQIKKITKQVNSSFKTIALGALRNQLLAGSILTVIGINKKEVSDTILRTKVNLRFYSICEDNSGDLWLGTEKGLFLWKDDSLMPFHHERKPFTGWIDEICKKKVGKIIITTSDSGLAVVSESHIDFINTNNGLQSNSCNSLYYDSLKDVAYLGTNKGLSIISFGINKSFEIKNFNSSNGLDCGTIYSIFAKEGEILLCTNKGLIVFHETDLNPTAETPKVYLTKLEINSTDVAFQSNYFLKHNQNNVRVVYNGIAFRNAKNLEYRYQLLPADTGWHRTYSNTIVYADLNPGNYRFNVQVYSGNQKWSTEAATFSFNISKPYWNTWWFRILAALILSSILVSYYHARIGRIRKKQQITNELLQTELKALRAQINPHFIFNSLNSIQDFIFRNEKEEANSYLSKFASLMRMILDNSSKKFISLQEEICFINLYVELESLRFQGKFKYMLQVSTDIITDNSFLPPMILQPYIENAIIHGLAPKKSEGILTLSFTLENNFLVCIIEDNGTGRKKPEEAKEQAVKSGHHSFAMKANNERIEAINKSQQVSIEYKIEDMEDKNHQPTGTKIVLNFPQDPESSLS